jgi:hypothetical protein
VKWRLRVLLLSKIPNPQSPPAHPSSIFDI